MNKDFNTLFWKTWGVNNRVYESLDVFAIKSPKSIIINIY